MSKKSRQKNLCPEKEQKEREEDGVPGQPWDVGSSRRTKQKIKVTGENEPSI